MAFKSGYVAIFGRPNVGKSTLINQLLDFRLSITTAKPQTTRHRILGIKSDQNYQIIFTDTPGLIDPVYALQEAMLRAARAAVKEADICLYLTETTVKPGEADTAILSDLCRPGVPVVLGINKIDLLETAEILPLVGLYRDLFPFTDIVPISALRNRNLDRLLSALLHLLPEGPALYPEDMITDSPERFFVSEIIREQVFKHYGEEIPYATAVVIDEFRERTGAKDHIRARIVVERVSQKGILIGKGGLALKRVGREARLEIERFLGRPVYLEIWVAVREKWRRKAVYLKEFGYDKGTRE